MISGLYAIPAIHLRRRGRASPTPCRSTSIAASAAWSASTPWSGWSSAPRARPGATRRPSAAPTWCGRSRIERRPAPSTTPATTSRGSTRRSSAPTSPAFQRAAPRLARRGQLRGIGVGPYVEGTGGVPQEYAEVRVLPTGDRRGADGQPLAGPGPRDRLRPGGRRAARRAVRVGAHRHGRHRPGGEGRRHVRLALDGAGGQRGRRSVGRVVAAGQARWRRTCSRRPPPTSSIATARSASSAPTGRSASSTSRAPPPPARCRRARHHARRRDDAREPGVRVRQRLRGVRAGGRSRDRRGHDRRADRGRRLRPLGEPDDRARSARTAPSRRASARR